MTSDAKHKWIFAAHFRARAFGWSGSQLACKRLREAISELKKAARTDKALAGEGAVTLICKISPALEQVDSSSGAIGTGVFHAVNVAADFVAAAPVDASIRNRWLKRLYQALEDDAMPYIEMLGDRFGDMCATPDVAGTWADALCSTLRTCLEFNREHKAYGHFKGDTACLSCLVAAERYQECMDMIALQNTPMWHYRRYGVEALRRMGRGEEALQYALDTIGKYVYDPAAIYVVCEEILLEQGKVDEAFEQFALIANRCTTNLATFRAIRGKYPDKHAGEILSYLIDEAGDGKGKWFATAKEIGLYDTALELVESNPCDPFTLIRAARDFRQQRPEFALGAATAAVKWIGKGYGYEVTNLDVREAVGYAKEAAEQLGAVSQAAVQLRLVVEGSAQVEKWVTDCLQSWAH